MLQVEVIMVGLMLIAAVRARAELDTARPFTWLMLGVFVAILLGSGWLWYTMEIRGRRTSESEEPGKPLSLKSSRSKGQ